MSHSASATSLSQTTRSRLSNPVLRGVLPYLICIGGFLLVWQALSLILGTGRLPGPINVITDTWDPYISQPFFDNGGTSKGLGWQILISLQRVALGYGLAAIVGIGIGGRGSSRSFSYRLSARNSFSSINQPPPRPFRRRMWASASRARRVVRRRWPPTSPSPSDARAYTQSHTHKLDR